MSIELLGEQTN